MKFLVIGASARAAAESVRRAGFDVAALDLFADRDLRDTGPCQVIEKFPESIFEQASRWADHLVVLCGGLENYPDLLRLLESRHGILGPNAIQTESLRNIANWKLWVEKHVQDDWLRFPQTLIGDEAKRLFNEIGPPNDHKIWLRKSYRGAGGQRVKIVDSADRFDPFMEYLQAFIPGPVLGITFVCRRNGCSVRGVMQNLTSSDILNEGINGSSHLPFLYAGSTGPIALPSSKLNRLADWIACVAAAIDYQGIVQADFIAGEDGRLYLLEFNPRWTAGMELIEMCSPCNLIQEQLHLQFPDQFSNSHLVSRLPNGASQSSESHTIAIKRIVYADERQVIPLELSDAMMRQSRWNPLGRDRPSQMAGWADIPNAGTTIEIGSPIATAWAWRSCDRPVDASRVKWPEIDSLIQIASRV